jgi:glycosyltransferase involved in cell wall biosynthesis
LTAAHGHDSFVVGSWANAADFRPPCERGDYVLYAAPKSAFHKRVDWVELACRRLSLPLVTTYQNDRSRQEYCEIVKGCRCYVMAAFEESNATIPALEAALCGKPVLASRLPACVEELGDAAQYFDPWDFGDLLRRLSDVYRLPHPASPIRERVVRLFSLEAVAGRIVRRLKELESWLKRTVTSPDI